MLAALLLAIVLATKQDPTLCSSTATTFAAGDASRLAGVVADTPSGPANDLVVPIRFASPQQRRALLGKLFAIDDLRRVSMDRRTASRIAVALRHVDANSRANLRFAFALRCEPASQLVIVAVHTPSPPFYPTIVPGHVMLEDGSGALVPDHS